MLEFMRALEVQALRLYQDKCFIRYDVLEQVRAANVAAITARLRSDYPRVKIDILCVGLRLRVLGDTSAAQNDGFYCQFRLYPAEEFRARHCATLSVMDLAGAGMIDAPAHHFRLSQDIKLGHDVIDI